MALTFEQVQARIQRNKPVADRSVGPKSLLWERETTTSIIETTGKYRIVKREDPDLQVIGYSLELCATPTSAPKHLCGPFLLPRDARDAAQRHYEGLPLQADLA